jgi:uncharacterized protein
MLWQRGRRSENVLGGGSGGGGRSPLGGGRGLGLTGVIIVIIVGLLFGKNPGEILSLLTGAGGGTAPSGETTAPPEGPGTDFVRAILGSTEDVWQAEFGRSGSRYPAPHLVVFQQGVRSACGIASSAVGPFYCSADQRVYLDLTFFDEMERRFQAAGDFARAYVIAHEVGHHVQNVTGVMEQVQNAGRRGAPMEGAEGMSVRQELQADCYAGVWANRAQAQLQWLEAGDIEEALGAATAIGDDRLQRQSQGYVVPDSFTHGTSAQRVRWFKTGFERGDVGSCDTFSAPQL